MGWSCAAKASMVASALTAVIQEKFPELKVSNTLPGGGFWENSRREYADGAITGTVWRPLTAAEQVKWAHLSNVSERVQRAGSFKISAEGKIERFPRLPKEIKAEAEKRGAAEFARVYGARGFV